MDSLSLSPPVSRLREGFIIDTIAKTALDPKLRAIAAKWFALTVPEALADKSERSAVLRGSDAGRCALELWADVQGELTIPVDVNTQLGKFDPGSLIGGWLAALLATGLDAHNDAFVSTLEADTEYRGIPGHIDVLIAETLVTGHDGGRDYITRKHVVEFKSTYTSRAMTAPHVDKTYQVMQAGEYALGAEAESFSIVTIGLAAYLRKGELRMREDHYDTAAWKGDIDREIDRLEAAVSRLDPPEPDPLEAWRCSTCRFGACDRNTNKNGAAK